MNRENTQDLSLQEEPRDFDNNGQPQTADRTVDGYMLDNRYNAKYPILIFQISAACFVLIAALVLKYCFSDYYGTLKMWYLSTLAQSHFESNVDQPRQEQNQTSSSTLQEGKAASPEDVSDTSYVETGALMIEVLNKKTTVADFGYPLKNYVITSGFGAREDPFSGKAAVHNGIDLAADSGSEIYAALDGKVEAADCTNYYGNYLVISHGSVYTTLYGHCQKLLVNKGEQVKKGQKIALVGSTGRSTGPHLHFEISVGGRRVDPLKYIDL